MAYENLMVFTGNANPALAEGVAKTSASLSVKQTFRNSPTAK